MNGLYFTTDGKNYQEFQGLQEVTLETDMVDVSETKEIVTKDVMNSGTFELNLGFDTRRLIPRGQRNREILKRDGYLSPKNADFMIGLEDDSKKLQNS